jgi:cellulose 1,4-beta-cellobiosidase
LTPLLTRQCPKDIKYINGEANSLDWNATQQMGHYGNCCHEMDIWEANQQATAYTPHVCQKDGPFRCEGNTCGGGSADVCDAAGCDFNSYRVGDKTFFGPGADFQVGYSAAVIWLSLATYQLTNLPNDQPNQPTSLPTARWTAQSP